MYGISLGKSGYSVFYENGGARKSEFTFGQVKTILESLLDKKARNNGLGTHILRSLQLSGTCWYNFPRNSEVIGFSCESTESGTYSVHLMLTRADTVVEKLNRTQQQASAIAATRAAQAERRRLRSLGVYKKPPAKVLPSLAGASANLKRHFRNSIITFAEATSAIAYAAKLDQASVRQKFVGSIDERAVTTLRLKGGFVFRLDLEIAHQGLLNFNGKVEIRTTRDNTHSSYRRLRNVLRKMLKRERKARVTAERHYQATRQARLLHMRLVA